MSAAPRGETIPCSEIAFSVPGAQEPTKRPRVTKNGTYTPKNKWAEAVTVYGKQATRGAGWPLNARWGCEITLYGCHRRGDIDNYGKAVLDALTGVVWTNDNQVEELRVQRPDYAGTPYSFIRVWVLGG